MEKEMGEMGYYSTILLESRKFIIFIFLCKIILENISKGMERIMEKKLIVIFIKHFIVFMRH